MSGGLAAAGRHVRLLCPSSAIPSRCSPEQAQPHAGHLHQAPRKPSPGESGHSHLVESPRLLNANRRQITGTWWGCDLTLASNFPVQLAAQRRRKKHKNLCIKKNVKEKMKRMLND